MITTLVFDWGDTLMRVFPQYHGAMRDWPEAAAMPGIVPALVGLQDGYNLVVATNAADSSAGQVREALDRVGLGSFFSAIFTAAECAARKPDPAFFHAIQSTLGLQPTQLCMIGDSYPIDVLGAQKSGWSGLWYNPAGGAAPGLLPLQDLEITHFEQLASALISPDYPSYITCLAMLQEQQLPNNLLTHLHGVAAAAYQMAVWMRAAGVPVDPLLAQRGGLLHDLAKLRAGLPPYAGRISHAELAARLIAETGYPLLAEIARRHMFFSLTDPDSAPITWEQKLVYFADKIIEGGRLATLDERVAALCLRYPQDSTEIKTPFLH